MSEEPQIYYLSERDMAQAVEWLLITARRPRDAGGKHVIAPIPRIPAERIGLPDGQEDPAQLREAVLTALHSLTGQPWLVRPDGN